SESLRKTGLACEAPGLSATPTRAASASQGRMARRAAFLGAGTAELRTAVLKLFIAISFSRCAADESVGRVLARSAFKRLERCSTAAHRGRMTPPNKARSGDEHPNARRVRELFAAFRRGDLAVIEATIAPDATWHFPGRRGKLAGDHQGRDAIL